MRYPVEHPVVILVGPTAVGKTALALELAGELDAEIISADSRLFYRGMDIGTAKPSPQELCSVPHHLIDIAEPDQTYSLALFQREALRIIVDIQTRANCRWCGGTGSTCAPSRKAGAFRRSSRRAYARGHRSLGGGNRRAALHASWRSWTRRRRGPDWRNRRRRCARWRDLQHGRASRSSAARVRILINTS
jgi:hypothetical protein